MNKFIAAALLLVPVAAHSATLSWDPSDATLGPPAAFYKVYSSPVGPPASAVWSLFGSSTSTNLFITNNVWRMFHVTGVSSASSESDPGNVVTNMLAKPNPPGRATINASIDSGPSINGPWLEQTNVALTVMLDSTNQFYRSHMQIVMH